MALPVALGTSGAGPRRGAPMTDKGGEAEPEGLIRFPPVMGLVYTRTVVLCFTRRARPMYVGGLSGGGRKSSLSVHIPCCASACLLG
jgi:hypothetical protein